MFVKIVCMTVAGMAILLAFDTPEERGKDLFVRRCSGCHALDTEKEGPRLRGVYGRQAASLRGFAYSDALKKVTTRWDDAGLDRWLSDPDTVAPGTDMEFRVADRDERKALIAYLKSLAGTHGGYLHVSVGRTPWSARVPLDPLFSRRIKHLRSPAGRLEGRPRTRGSLPQFVQNIALANTN